MTQLIVVHTLMSLAAIVSGIPALLQVNRLHTKSIAVSIFLTLAFLTSFSGFFLPFKTLTPAVVISIVALVILAIVFLAKRQADGSRFWRLVYVGGIVISLYLLVFVGVVQAFMKVELLHAVAPTQAEPPFIVAQAIVLLCFVLIGVFVARPFRTFVSTAVR